MVSGTISDAAESRVESSSVTVASLGEDLTLAEYGRGASAPAAEQRSTKAAATNAAATLCQQVVGEGLFTEQLIYRYYSVYYHELGFSPRRCCPNPLIPVYNKSSFYLLRGASWVNILTGGVVYRFLRGSRLGVSVRANATNDTITVSTGIVGASAAP